VFERKYLFVQVPVEREEEALCLWVQTYTNVLKLSSGNEQLGLAALRSPRLGIAAKTIRILRVAAKVVAWFISTGLLNWRRFQTVNSGDSWKRTFMSKFRRQLLIFFGASAGTAVLAPALEKIFFGNKSVAQAADPLKFTPVRLPHPYRFINSSQVSWRQELIRDKH